MVIFSKQEDVDFKSGQGCARITHKDVNGRQDRPARNKLREYDRERRFTAAAECFVFLTKIG